MRQRLQKIISAAGLCSRRTAEEWIAAGRVQVNGTVAALGEQADPELDEILLDGKIVRVVEKKLYIMLNKPRGYVTTLQDEKGRPNVSELVADCGERVYPVGRLDIDSEGLLLLTNDGEWMQHVLHPKYEVDKTYHVTVAGKVAGALAGVFAAGKIISFGKECLQMASAVRRMKIIWALPMPSWIGTFVLARLKTGRKKIESTICIRRISLS